MATHTNPIDLKIRPTVIKDDTNLVSEGFYTHSDKIRFDQRGRASRIGGWEVVTTSTLDGRPCGLHTWSSLRGVPYSAFGTTEKLYTLQDNTLRDRTWLGDLRDIELVSNTNNFIAVGQGGELVTASTSNLNNWTSVNSNAASSLITGVTNNNTHTVAVCSGGKYIYAENTDLENWTVGHINAFADDNFTINDIAFCPNHNQWIAVGAAGTVAWTANVQNTLSWTVVNTNTTAELLTVDSTNVASPKDTLLIGGTNGTLLTATNIANGVTARTSNITSDITAAHYSNLNDTWVITATLGQLATCTNANGVTWSAQTSSFANTDTIRDVHAFEDTGNSTTYWTAVGSNGKAATATNAATSWTQVTTTNVANTETFEAILYASNTWLATTSDGNILTTTTPDTSDLTPVTNPNTGRDLSTTRVNGVSGLGYGIGGYGTGTYGIGSDTPLSIFPRTWTGGSYGEELQIAPRFGRIYTWAPGSDLPRSTPLANSPGRVGTYVITPEGYPMALGTDLNALGETTAYDPMRVIYADPLDITDWRTRDNNLSREQRLYEGNALIAGLPSTRETLIWSDTALYAAQFNPAGIDPYDFQLLGKNCGCIGPLAAIVHNGRAFWMSTSGDFYMYDGGAPTTIDSGIRDYVFDNLDRAQYHKVVAALSVPNSEVWWFYPCTSQENNKYVKYNWTTGGWDVGTLDRTVWRDAGPLDFPIAADPNGNIFYQERGLSADGAPIEASLTTAPFDMGDGAPIMLIDRFVHDIKANSGSLKYELRYRKFPQAPMTTKGPYTVNTTTQYTDLKVRGRQVSLHFFSDGVDDDWKLGTLRLNTRPAGFR